LKHVALYAATAMTYLYMIFSLLNKNIMKQRQYSCALCKKHMSNISNIFALPNNSVLIEQVEIATGIFLHV
jgi:hypothetical protein